MVMLRYLNPARGIFRAGGLVTAVLLALGACTSQSPESVCGSPETLAVVRGLLLETMTRSSKVDMTAAEEAFADMATIELITFEGMDDQTKNIRCRAQVRTTGTNSQFAINFSRQPTVDTGFAYKIEFNSMDAWNALGMQLVPRASAIERARDESTAGIAADEASGSSSLREAPQGSTTMHQYQDAEGNWPGGTDSPSLVTERPGSGTPPPQATPSAIPSDGLLSQGFRTLELEGSDGVTLAKFEEWAKERERGDVKWHTSGTGLSMRLTWEYDDGRRTVVETTFEPAGQGRVRLGETRHDGRGLSAQGARELIDGITLDMYHRGMIGN